MSTQPETTPAAIRIAAETAAARPADSLSDRVRSLKLDGDLNSGRPVGTGWLWLMVVLLIGWSAVVGFYLWRRDINQAATIARLIEERLAEMPKAGGSVEKSAGHSGTTSAVTAPGDIAHEAKGYIVPVHQILVSPKVSGMIEKLSVEEGLRVKKGDVLAQIETIDYKADRDHSAAMLTLVEQRLLELERGNRPEEIEQARAEFAEAQAQVEQLEAAWKRAQELRKRNVVSETEYEQAQSLFKAMDRRVERLNNALKVMVEGPRKERIEAARAEVGQAKADLAKAEWRLDNCTIRAPVTGTILKKRAEEGNIVNSIAMNGSFSIVEMADLSDLEVDLSIQERDIAKISVGQSCVVRADAFSERKYDGIVSRLMPIADRSKGAVNVRVKVTIPADEEGVYLKPEMSTLVVFLKGKPVDRAATTK